MVAATMAACGNSRNTPAKSEGSTASQQVGPTFSADSAYAFCQRQCDFGPRTMNSEAHEKCGQWIAQKFASYGLEVTEQRATLKGFDGTPLLSNNIIASYRPELKDRILICAHWDSRPWADNDPDEANWTKPVLAANDGASGVAVMLELARIITGCRPQDAEVGLQTADQRPQTSDHGLQTADQRPQTSDHGLQTSDQRPQTSDHGLQTSDQRPQDADHGLQTSDHRPQDTDLGLQTSDHRPQTSSTPSTSSTPLPPIGVDFICFDAEDWGSDNVSDSWALGAQHWAAHPHREGYSARYGILLDMVGGQGARFYREGFSMYYAPKIVEKVWRAADDLGYGSIFLQKDGHAITDDHGPVNNVAGIPCIDIIPHYPDCRESSFGPTWHTINDDMAHIDANTLKAVGQTLVQIIFSEKP